MTATHGTIVTRFAPSPTGHLHVGGARTALLNWAYARGRNGKFLIRIEDTDRARSSVEAERGMLEDLKWIGLDWDNTGEEPRQSERLKLYDDAIAKLKEAERAYDDDEAVRFRMPDHDITVEDKVLGNVTVAAGQIEDFVIKKRDGFPTYHLAVVVDDADMGVNTVIRGQEHLNNAPKHVALQQALGLPTPTYAHIPLIFNMDGSKMSKRDKAKVARKAAKAWLEDSANSLDNLCTHVITFGPIVEFEAVHAFIDGKSDDPDIAQGMEHPLGFHLPEIDVADFRRSGYLPEALCNYLALLGWNPGNDLEHFDNAFLATHFDFDRVGKSNSKFDREKLVAFNGDAIRTMPVGDFAAKWRAYCEAYRPAFAERFDDAAFTTLAEAYHERTKTFADVCEMAEFFVAAPTEYDAKAVKKNLTNNDGAGFAVLRDLRSEFANLDDDDFGTAAHELIRGFAEARELNMGKVAQPVRVAVSGGTVTPPIDLTLGILGKDETLARIDACIAAHDG